MSVTIWFQTTYSTSHTLISLTEDITKNLDKGNNGSGIFLDLQEAFDTVEHDILSAKVEITVFMASQIIRLNHISSTENNLFQ